MISGDLSPNLASTFALFNSVGQRNGDDDGGRNRSSPLKPVEQLAASGRGQLRARETDSLQAGETLEVASSSALGYPLGVGDADAPKNVNGDDPAQAAGEAGREQDAKQAQSVISQLAARDREVRAHEQAHSAVGGQYAGAAQYQYQRGPNGVRYAVAGEVPIQIGKEPTPEATLQKAQVVKRAALAPAEPSPQDRRVAAEASRLMTEARQDLASQRSDDATKAEAGSEGELATAASSSGERNSAQPSSKENTVPSLADTIRSSGNSLSSRLNEGIANASLSSRELGSILDQLA